MKDIVKTARVVTATERAATVGPTVSSGPIDDIYAALARRPAAISFAVGAPDQALLPGDLVASMAAGAITKHENVVLQSLCET